MYLFVDHLGNFRICENKPIKYSMRKPILHHTEEEQDYHGHFMEENYYIPSDEIIEYWGFMPLEDKSWSYPRSYYPSIPTIGHFVPKSIIKDKYLKMTFDSEPVLIV